MSLPSKITRPPLMTPGGWSKRRIAFPSVDLPLPDSPTRPTNSPGWSWKVTSRIANSGGRCLVAYVTSRCSTSSRAIVLLLPQLWVAERVHAEVDQDERGGQQGQRQAG